LRGLPPTLPPETLRSSRDLDAYRLRVGKYRILYRVVWDEMVIIIFRNALRRRPYKDP